VEEGECLLIRPWLAPVQLQTNDFVLFRTCTPVTFTSDPTVEPVDSEAEAANGMLGDGTQNPVIVRGGRFVLDSANEHLLTDLIPPLVHIKATDALSWKMRALIQLNEAEASQPGPGSDFIIVRLMELLLIEIIRSEALHECRKQASLLAGLADPVTARALSAMHMDVAREWTVVALARIAGVSRSSFASRFCRVVGIGPIEYLIKWRMAIARDELRRGTLPVGVIGLRIGFQSASAFSKAFTRSVGCSPKRFADRYAN
jgi:AraC-like DNA-binding protein